MASDKQFDLRKTENSVRSKCYPEDLSKDIGKKTNFRKSCKNFNPLIHNVPKLSDTL